MSHKQTVAQRKDCAGGKVKTAANNDDGFSDGCQRKACRTGCGRAQVSVSEWLRKAQVKRREDNAQHNQSDKQASVCANTERQVPMTTAVFHNSGHHECSFTSWCVDGVPPSMAVVIACSEA